METDKPKTQRSPGKREVRFNLRALAAKDRETYKKPDEHDERDTSDFHCLYYADQNAEFHEWWDASRAVLACSQRYNFGSPLGVAHILAAGWQADENLVGTRAEREFIEHLIKTRAPFFEGAETAKEIYARARNSLLDSGPVDPEDQIISSEKERLSLLADAANGNLSATSAFVREAQEARDDTVQLLGGASTLGRAITSDEDVVEAVSAGFPAGVLAALRESGLPPAALEQVIAPKRTLMRRKADKQRLTRTESDAAWRLADAVALATRVLDGRNAAIDWMFRPKAPFQGRSALDLLETSVGSAYVKRLLNQLDRGDVA